MMKLMTGVLLGVGLTLGGTLLITEMNKPLVAMDHQFEIDATYNKAKLLESLCKMRVENKTNEMCIQHNKPLGHNSKSIF